ncbi:GNAT family N-acetyltransferase [Amycolatopsis sp. H20-H5]|uniref:GNAT family N-acetyltransferase n=1 Tax=Amycolatopsis sp. H20-H5 TaxID=3046309 RepID=UPI002DB8FF38|nr:GNAT family protein [Amycolatopsis sp. H20-H5]MEC3981561.1 GNAT family protein [Amycolatopsis sp. H20-H5]
MINVGVNINALRVQPDLRGDSILLTQLDGTYAAQCLARLNDPETRRLTGTHDEFDLEQVRAWHRGLAGRDDRADWVILHAETGEFLGDVSFNVVDVANRSAQFRIALAAAAPGRGYGTSATRLVLDYGFDVVGLHRVGLEVFDYNPRARRVYEKCGFVAEGVKRQALRWDGEWHDVVVMAALATERGRPG